MTAFGWIMVAILAIAVYGGGKNYWGRAINLFLLVGTLLWGTGSL